ncbi:MAG: Flagellar biosynthesis protein FlhF [Candidatus Poribacteria bacterium]|nr:Flagellar biosynthesis protein FlhF [Candidatus Poribacteria bacterium]
MTINRYRANNLKSAMDKAFVEMGPDAKILEVRQLDKYSSESNGQSSELVEIIAVIDDDLPDVQPSSEQNESKYQEPNKNSKNTRRHSIDMLVEDDYDLIPNTPSHSRKAEKKQTKEYKTLYEALNIRSNSSSSDFLDEEANEPIPKKQNQYVEELKKKGVNKKNNEIAKSIEPKPIEPEEIGQSKRSIHVENPKTSSANPEQSALIPPNPHNSAELRNGRTDRSYEQPKAKQRFVTEQRELSGVSKSRISHVLHECLTRNQVNNELAYEVLSLLNDKVFTLAGEEKELSARNYLSTYMEQKINVSKGLDTSKKVTILIGPTGVGKTTTLAKLAAQYQFHKNKNVGLITIDAYRIAAIDQLKTYAQIMSIPLKVALTPEQLWKCIDEYDGMDLVLVDTPGRSHLNKKDIRTIEEFLEAAQPADTHLLISASTKDIDAYTVVETFAPEYVQKFLFTKLDETTSFGSIMNVCAKLKKPISYLTMGQNVPDDIRLADIDFLVDLFVTKNRLFREL